MDETLSNPVNYAARARICDLGYLRHLYRKADGTIGYRCPAEPLANYRRKGGSVEQTVGRKCICNSLPATVGLGQVRPGGRHELPLVTAGDDLAQLAEFIPPGQDTYTAADVLRRLLSGHPSALAALSSSVGEDASFAEIAAAPPSAMSVSLAPH